ncbi:hypothetical protein PGT21_028435 [Puccinia graminis f. sp. tritici]|uniref:Uncharacterized protein n=1 Tax=Puccinia graminis f. sp. tritici TaxID=56615 RepID=A0A5B0QJP2_PUCGR|nr:hypothetical protein PGT21_028435 [Puccinia graminis f. sp. tritici]
MENRTMDMDYKFNEDISLIESLVGNNHENGVVQSETDGIEEVHKTNTVPLDVFEEEPDEEDNDNVELAWLHFLELAIGQISSEPEDRSNEASLPSFHDEEINIQDITPDKSVWFPFPSKEYLIGLLLIGYLHKLISRDLYHQIRIIFMLYTIKLPCWEALQIMRVKIRSMSNHSVIKRQSVFDQPIFALDAKELISDVRFDESIGRAAP